MISEPKIVYVDGINPWDNCRPGLKRSLSALTGLLISHSAYGSEPYNASRNCFLTVAVPVGFRLRLKALDFDVQGRWKHCEHEDTLHIFDHDRTMEAVELASEQPLPAAGSPGRMLGEFCGQIPQNEKKNKKFLLLAESSFNALTLWWHTEPRQNDEKDQPKDMPRTSTVSTRPIVAEGFRLLWSSFRHAEKCRQNATDGDGLAEFACQTKNRQKVPSQTTAHLLVTEECIPAPLACNSYADCADDEADLHPRRQLAHGCQHIPNDFIGLLTTSSGPKKLALCAALVTVWLSICLGCCCCWMHFRRKHRTKKRLNRQQNDKEQGPMLKHAQQQQIIHDDFYHQIQPPPPPMAICNFSPPQLPSQGPPMAPHISHPLPPKLHHTRHVQHRHQILRPSSGSGGSGGGSSSSSAQRQQNAKQPPPNKSAAMNPAGSTSTATTATTSAPNNELSTAADSGEYFYVQQLDFAALKQQQQQNKKMPSKTMPNKMAPPPLHFEHMNRGIMNDKH
uniref:CUB domain-containing protein n=1 Tax=Globodera rostochiensis TaxID=31243 RepID=A0A914HXE9_GLORO